MSAPQVWDATLGQLLLRVTRQNYDTWLRNTAGLRFEGTTLVVAAASDLACDWLRSRLRTVIAQALTAVAGPGLSIRYEASPTAAAPDAENAPAMQTALIPGPATPLNPRYTFASFLEADFNRLALTAGRDLGVDGNTNYSPLFITGGDGSGKTHLLHAIAHEATKQKTRVLLVTAEQFLSEFTTAVRNHNGAEFRGRYRELDLLLIDDIHILLGKKATLNEFYQTLAVLHDQGRRLAVAGDPSAMAMAEARFRGQLRWGLVAEIRPPSIEDRVMFVTNRALYQGIELPDEVRHYLALRVRSSIRDLEGAVNRVAALARISKKPLTIDFAAKALQPIAQGTTAAPHASPIEFLDAVCRHLGLTPETVTSQKRDHDLSYARHLAMYLIRQDAGLTYAAIAKLLGKKDHSTVVHGCTQVARDLRDSPAVRADIDAIRAAIHNSGTAA
jgi:chromosomal replication initiator protein